MRPAGFEFYLGSSSFTTSSSSGSLDSDAERPSHAASVSSIRRSLQRSDSCSGGQAMFFQRDAHTCFTADGWRLHLTRVHDPETCSSRQYPVVMVPGLASSGEHTFDLLPDYSLANALVALGYDVWVVDLRGACSLSPLGPCLSFMCVGCYPACDVTATCLWPCTGWLAAWVL